ncbi:neuferricin isoform X1 [Pelobates cultripes]|uniref:Neuferricin n=1 Tax=Pelobates cultripes TaxID=61616 RepID=A0AAD1TLJ6_PELCU|nr:neuferricin isoform X1 [Pelobates cultripes]CAH2330077.1 neuferricin isoform X1 [Pelobates cultripes]
MFGYLAAAIVCAAAVLIVLLGPASFPSVPGLISLFAGSECGVSGGRVLGQKELSEHNGGPGSPGLYLAVLGLVFDVKKGSKHYGPGGSYSFFAGKDASRAYVTGDFTEKGLVDDLSELSPLGMLHLNNWLSFYRQNYDFVGKLVGRFYDKKGQPTKALEDALAVIDIGLKLKEQRIEENKQFPPCNVESSSGISRVWCSNRSGGIHRDWVGVPRKMYLAGSDGYRCVCVRTSGPPTEHPDSTEHRDRGDLDNPLLKEYEECNPLFDWCLLKE